MATQEQGYEDKRFKEVIDITLRCHLCKNVVKDPVQCRGNHEDLFCRICITGYLEQYPQTCPTCGEDLTVETLAKPARAVTNMLSSHKISCDFAARGCPEFIKLDQLRDHVINCDYSQSVCTNQGCLVEVNKRDKRHHEIQECVFRKVKCDDCGQELKQKLYHTHGCVLKNEVNDLKENLERMKHEMKRMKDEMMREMKLMKEAIEGPHHFKTRRDIIVIGGWEGKSRLNLVEMFCWTKGVWKTLKPMKQPRSAASLFVYNQQVFVAGGTGIGGEKHESIEKMSCELTEWLDFNAKLPFKCYGHSCIVHKDRVIFIGGYNGHEVSDGIYEIRLTRPYSTKLLSRMPEPRFCHSSQLVGDKILIFGGMTRPSNTGSTDGVMLFDIATNECKEMPPLPYAVNSAASIVSNSKVIVVGGADAMKNGNAMKTAVMYDANTGEHEMLPPMRCERDGCSAIITGNVIVVMGGYNSENKYLNSVECFNLSRYEWGELPSMNVNRAYSNAIVKP